MRLPVSFNEFIYPLNHSPFLAGFPQGPAGAGNPQFLPIFNPKPLLMKIVRVQYTTRAEFAARNRENIAAVAAEVRALGLPGTVYSCYVMPDGKTFMHLDHFETEEAHQRLQGLASFKKFADELHASGLEAQPMLVLPELVAASR